MQTLNNLISFIRRQPRWRLVLAAAIVIIGALYWWRGGQPSAGKIATFAARRGPLDITVLEGGSLQALESQESKCEVRVGYQGTKILKIVDEGYLVMEDDVKTNKMLVELDSSDLEDKIVQQEIQYQCALASLTDAQQNYEIQLNQNLSDVKGAEQKVRFARMDFDKFLGDAVTEDIVKKLGLDELLAAASTNDVSAAIIADDEQKDSPQPIAIRQLSGNSPRGRTKLPDVRIASAPTGNKNNAPSAKAVAAAKVADEMGQATFQLPSTADIDFSQYARIDVLGDGEAKQKLRKFEDDLQVAQKELRQAMNTLEGTRRLFEKGFVTKNDLQRDEIAYDNSRLKVQTAETARDLFIKYDFPKSAEQSLSTYLDAVRELDKTRRQAVSKLAQAKAKLRSAEGQFAVQSRRRKELHEQVEKCFIRAKKTGLVVYGSGRNDRYYGNQEPVLSENSVRADNARVGGGASRLWLDKR
jgi:HlyD family secretion protein